MALEGKLKEIQELYQAKEDKLREKDVLID